MLNKTVLQNKYIRSAHRAAVVVARVTVPRTIPRALAQTAACGLILFFHPPFAFAGGGMSGGAMESTQLMNNAELVAQVGESMQQTSNTLRTAFATMQQLRQLPPDMLEKVAGGVLKEMDLSVADLKTMSNAYETFNKASSAYRDAAGVMRTAGSDLQRFERVGMSIPVDKYLSMYIEKALRGGDAAAARMDAQIQTLQRAAGMSKAVQDSAAAVSKIDSSTAGLQMLAQQNLKTQQILIESLTAVAQAGAAVAQQNRDAADRDAADGARRQAAARSARKAADGEQLDRKIKLPGELVK